MKLSERHDYDNYRCLSDLSKMLDGFPWPTRLEKKDRVALEKMSNQVADLLLKYGRKVRAKEENDLGV